MRAATVRFRRKATCRYAETIRAARNFPHVFAGRQDRSFIVKSESPEAPAELWRTDMASEKSERALPGISMLEFDVSDDAKEVVYSAQPPGKPSQIWVAPWTGVRPLD